VEVSQLIGLDVGQKRIGVARASSVAKLAEPLTAIKTFEGLDKLQQIVKQESAGTIVVGLPRSLQGDDTAQTTWVRGWVDGAKKRIKLPFYWQDEALTSHIAEAERQAHKSPHDVDALAAAIILQDFLDAPETQRSLC
jgi:putative Holliday junction resolvase